MTVSAITLPDVDAIVAQVSDRVNQTAQAVRSLTRGLLNRLSQPYTGHLGQPGMGEKPAAGSAVMDWEPVSAKLDLHSDRMRRNRPARGLGNFCYTISNHVEASGSSSLTDSSQWLVWADDFEHEGL